MIRLLPLVFSFLVFAPSVKAQLIVGNPGEGVMSEGNVYLRDLYESGNHREPFVGSTAGWSIRPLGVYLAALEGVPVDKDILLRKLADAELLQAGFGQILARAIAFYRWYLVQGPLASVGDDAPILLRPGDVPVQLANRHRNSVRMDRDLFMKLSPIHRAALILHEAIYSLVKLECEPTYCRQLSPVARDTTAALFSPQTARCKGNCLGGILKSGFDVDWSVGRCAHLQNDIAYRFFEYSALTVMRSQQIRLNLEEDGAPDDNLREAARKICDAAESLDDGKTWHVDLQLSRFPMALQSIFYRSGLPEPLDPQQLALRAAGRPSSLTTDITLEMPIFCYSKVLPVLKDWYSGISYPTLPSSKLSSKGIPDRPGRTAARSCN